MSIRIFITRGIHSSELRQLWQNRRAQYELLACEVSEVEVDYDRATVFMTMTFQSADGTLSYSEPQTYGDASYFIRDGGIWKLYGDQSW